MRHARHDTSRRFLLAKPGNFTINSAMDILTPIYPSLGNLPGQFPLLLRVGKPCPSHRLQSPASHVRASATPPATFQRKAQLASSCQKFPQTVIPLKAWVQRWKLEQFRSTLHIPPQHVRVDPGSHGGWCLAFLGGEGSSLIWGSPAWIALAHLPQTCFFLLSLPKEGLNLLENR